MAGGAPRRFKALLFDFYDTLAWLDEDLSNRRRGQLAERVGVSLDRLKQVWRQSIRERMLGKGGTLADHLGAVLETLAIAPDPALLAELAAMDLRRLEESVHLYPSAAPVLRRLAAEGYRLGLLSNVTEGAAHPIFHLGLDRLFHELILSHQVGLLKPDPAIFELGCRRLEAAPEETVFVADGGFSELDAAHGLGIYSVRLEQERQSKDFGFSTVYDATIHDLAELEGLLSALETGAPDR